MRVVPNAVDHEVAQMAELMRNHIDELHFITNDLLRELDIRRVLEPRQRQPIRLHIANLLPPPVRSPRSRVQLLRPDELHASRARRQLRQLAIHDRPIELVEEGLRELLLAHVPRFLHLARFFGLDRTGALLRAT